MDPRDSDNQSRMQPIANRSQRQFTRRETVRGRVFMQDIRPVTRRKISLQLGKTQPAAPNTLQGQQRDAPNPNIKAAITMPSVQSKPKNQPKLINDIQKSRPKPTPTQRMPQRSQVVMRKVVAKPVPAVPIEKKKTKKRDKKSIILLIMAVILFAAGVFVVIDGWNTNRKIESQIKQSTTSNTDNLEGSTSTDPPATDKPSDNTIANYAVAPDMPRYFKMPQHGITKARILPMGVDDKNVLKSPTNVHDVGWYDASSRPGQGGVVLLDAHVSSWTTSGVFYHIKDLKPGDTITVERGDGQEFTYKVVKSQEYDYKNVDMNAAILPVTAGKPGLNMITCAGKVIPGTNEFDKRLIVFTEQV